MSSKTNIARRVSKSANRNKPGADDLERIIVHLDTLYEQGDDCIQPDTGIIVTDGEYDALRRELRSLRPKSKVFRTATASKLASTVQKVVHAE